MQDKVLKHLGLLSILLMVLQIIPLAVIGLEKSYSIQQMILDAGRVLLVAYLSYIWCGVKEKVVGKSRTYTIIGGLLVFGGRVVTCVSAVYYPIKQYIRMGVMAEVWFGIILIVLFAFAYIFMYINYRRDYDRIINLEIYILVLSIGVVACFFGIGGWSIVGLAAVTIVGAVCRNQSSIDYLLERTQKNTPMVKQLRRHNVKWVLVAMLFLIVAYSVSGIVAEGLKMGWQGIAYVIASIMRLLFRPGEGQQLPTDVGTADMGTVYGMAEGNGSNIYKIIACIVLVVLCILKRKEIWAFIKRIAKVIAKRIHQFVEWLQKVLFHVEKKEEITTLYYTDRVEEIRDIEAIKIKKTSKLSKRRLERQLKELSKIKDLTKQYREKYKLLIQGLIWQGVLVEKSNTPREINEKVEDSTINLQLTETTKDYEHTRYGQIQATSASCEHLDEQLKSLINQRKK